MEAVDRGETTSAMEPLLIPDGSRHRAALTDLAFDLTQEVGRVPPQPSPSHLRHRSPISCAR